MAIKVNIPQPQTSGLQHILGAFGQIGGTSKAFSTVKGWTGGGPATDGATTTAMPDAGASAGGDAAAADSSAADAAAGDAAAADSSTAADALLYRGGLIRGRDRAAGDSPINDTVRARLSPGEMVIPRSIVGEGPEAVRKFAMEAMKRRMGGK